jgi:FkbM family methyltransferase
MSELTQRPLSRSRRAYRFVNRPYYWYRPSQLAARLRTKTAPDGGTRLLRTAWGSNLECWPDSLGSAIARTGVYDLTVAETLARLADPGETAVDAGANVGVMSNLLAHAVGADGRVVSFEPHPLIFETLQRNASRWRENERLAPIDIRQAAVSSRAGVLTLRVDPEVFAHNKGTASLERGGTSLQERAGASSQAQAGEPSHEQAGTSSIEPSDSPTSTQVATIRLDQELDAPIAVLKLDVEGHELEALRGAASLLSHKLIRDILFEAHLPPPTPVTELLESYGYTIMGIHQGFSRPILSAPADAYELQLWDPPTLIATAEPERACERLRRRGWTCLRGRSRWGELRSELT